MYHDEKFFTWINDHIKDDPSRLWLKYSAATDDFDYTSAILQVECRQRFGKKLAATLGKSDRFIFPNALSGEQSTSDRFAAFHATLLETGTTLADLTAGLGIDAIHAAQTCKSVTAIERDATSADALRHNAQSLGRDNITVISTDCRDYISSHKAIPADTAFIDPARRAADGSRLFALTDCEPDVTAMLPALSRFCNRLIVKMSPMLDISHTLASLGGCDRVIAIGNATECKELVAIKDFNATASDPIIESVTLKTDADITFSFHRSDEQSCPAPMASSPSEGDYLYEPFPSMMKAGAQKLLASRFGLSTFHPNTRLYHSSSLVNDFPGEIFVIERIIDYASKNIKRIRHDYPMISVSARNFGISAEALRAKLGVRDGGSQRLIAVTDHNCNRKMLIVKKA